MAHNNQTPELLFELQSFLIDCEARNLRPSTLEYYRQHLTWMLEYVFDQGATQVESITPRHLRSYLVDLQRRKWRPATVAGAYRAMRVFFAFLVRDEILETSPLAKIAAPRVEKSRKEPFSRDDVKSLLAAAHSPRDKALILFLLDTGARVSEVLAINFDDVDLATGRVLLRHTKDREERFAYLGTAARRQLLRYYRQLTIRANAPIWTDPRTGKRLQRNGVNQLLTRIGKRAGVSPCGPHRFRRTFAIEFLRNGGDVFTLQRILGHSTLDMVKKYLDGLNDDDAAEQHKRYSPGDRL